LVGVAELFQVEQVVVIGHIQLVTLAPADLPQVGCEEGDDQAKGDVAAQVGDDRPERLPSLGFSHHPAHQRSGQSYRFRFWVAIACLSRVLSGSLNWMIGSSTTGARASSCWAILS
jgi:hypothetical protein